MPYKIKQRGSKYVVIKAADGAVMGSHASKRKAEAQVRALYAREKKK